MVRMQPQQLASSVPDSMTVNPLFARRAEDLSVPRYVLPAESMLPETAYQIVHDEAMLDAIAVLEDGLALVPDTVDQQLRLVGGNPRHLGRRGVPAEHDLAARAGLAIRFVTDPEEVST